MSALSKISPQRFVYYDQRFVYYDIMERYGVSAHITICAIAKVEVYKCSAHSTLEHQQTQTIHTIQSQPTRHYCGVVYPKKIQANLSTAVILISKTRKDRDTFICSLCGFAGHADYIAALNIASRAALNQPNVSIS